MIDFIKKIVDGAKGMLRPGRGGAEKTEKLGLKNSKIVFAKTDENSLASADFHPKKLSTLKPPKSTGFTKEGDGSIAAISLLFPPLLPQPEPKSIEKLTSGDEIPAGYTASRVENLNGSAIEIVINNEGMIAAEYVYDKIDHKLPGAQVTYQHLKTEMKQEVKIFDYLKSEYTIIERDGSGREISREVKELTGEKALLGKEQAKQDLADKFPNIDAGNLMSLIDQGLLSVETLQQIPACASLIPELLSDIKLAQQAQEEGINLIDVYIPTLTSLDESSKVKNGEVFEVDEKLYISPDGEEKIELNISKEDYFQLFPPMERFLGNQGNVGDCYLITTLMEKYKDPYGKMEMLTSISKQGDDFLIKLNNTDISVLVPQGETDYVTNSMKVMDGCKGLQMFEYAFGISLMDKSAQETVHRLSEDISKLLGSDQNNIMEYSQLRDSLDKQVTFEYRSALELRGNGGNPDYTDHAFNDTGRFLPASHVDGTRSLAGQLFKVAFPQNYSESHSVEITSFENEESEVTEMQDKTTPMAKASIYGQLAGLFSYTQPGQFNYSPPENVAYFGGTKSPAVIDGNNRRLEQNLMPEKGIFSNHAYQCIPREDGTIDVINPWYCGFSMNLSQQEFDDCFSSIWATEYKTPIVTFSQEILNSL